MDSEIPESTRLEFSCYGLPGIPYQSCDTRPPDIQSGTAARFDPDRNYL